MKYHIILNITHGYNSLLLNKHFYYDYIIFFKIILYYIYLYVYIYIYIYVYLLFLISFIISLHYIPDVFLYISLI
jgi:hypothetical protein